VVRSTVIREKDIEDMAGFRAAFLTAGVLAACVAGSQAGFGAAAGGGFTVTSSGFSDGGMLTAKQAADDPMRMCGGQNISPPLQWSNVPAGTKSFAIVLLDPDGRLGEGVVHWIAYGIPANVTSFAEGEMTKQSEKFVGGKGTRNNALYIGPCPPVGDAPHHYVFTVIATDLEPTALKPGLTREEFYTALAGHGKGGASIVGKYAR
jgi:Raf kinase inhibitor-like YbhB/YbcL family protein